METLFHRAVRAPGATESSRDSADLPLLIRSLQCWP